MQGPALECLGAEEAVARPGGTRSPGTNASQWESIECPSRWGQGDTRTDVMALRLPAHIVLLHPHASPVSPSTISSSHVCLPWTCESPSLAFLSDFYYFHLLALDWDGQGWIGLGWARCIWLSLQHWFSCMIRQREASSSVFCFSHFVTNAVIGISIHSSFFFNVLCLYIAFEAAQMAF